MKIVNDYLVVAKVQRDLFPRQKEIFQQLTEFDQRRIIDLRKLGFSYRTVAARVQRNSSTVMRFLKQWTDENQTTRKIGSGRRKVTSARDVRRLLHMTVNDHTTSSRQLELRWSTATGVLISPSSTRRRLLHRRQRARVLLYRIRLATNHRPLCSAVGVRAKSLAT